MSLQLIDEPGDRESTRPTAVPGSILAEAAETSCVDESDPTGSPSPVERSFMKRRQLTYLDLFVLFTALLVPCLYLPVFFMPFLTPRILIMLIALVPGLIAIGSLVRQRDPAASFAAALITWSLVSATFSDSPLGSILGFAGQRQTVVGLSASLGLWALARFVSPAGRSLAMPFVLTGLGLNAAVGILQMVIGLEGTQLSLVDGRSIGLAGNAAYFATLMAMGAAISMVVYLRTEARRHVAGIGVVLFSVGVACSGTRGSLVVVLAIAVVIVVRTRRKSSLVVALLALVGMVAGTALTRVANAGPDVAARLSDLNSGSGGARLVWWADGLAAAAERPILGWGIGRFRTATQGRATYADIAAGFYDEQHMDAHNIVIGMLVAIGIPGLLLLVAFAGAALRRSSGPFVFGAVAAAASWMLQPIPLTTLPLVLIVLGLSSGAASPLSMESLLGSGDAVGRAQGEPISSMSRTTRRLMPIAALLGVLAAGWFAVAEIRFERALNARDIEGLIAASEMYHPDPIIDAIVSDELTIIAAIDRNWIPRLVDRLERSVEREPSRPVWLTNLARVAVVIGDVERGEALAREALELQPTHPPAWGVLLMIAELEDDADDRADARRALCLTGDLEMCDPAGG